MRPVTGYEGLYSVSEDGRVYAEPKQWISGNGRSCSHDGRWLNQRPDKNGYLKVMLCHAGKLKHIAAHRLVALAYIPNPKNKPQVNHLDGVKSNNVVSNLEWATQSENQLHKYRTGLGTPLSGERHVMA